VTLTVAAPLEGQVVALADVPDPVFAQLVVGAGAAVEPDDGATDVVVVAPVAGRLVKVHPHAFVVLADSGAGVLVHLGINTVRLGGAGFTLLAAQGDEVAAGHPVVRFDPTAVRVAGLSAVCPVVVMQSPAETISAEVAPGGAVRREQPLFRWAPKA
jgi:PTS system glucose-specific IIA component